MRKLYITLLALAFCLNGRAQCTVNLAANTYTICEGDSQTLQALGASSYTWSANAGSATTATVNVTPSLGTTIYTVTGTTGTCTATNTATVTAVPLPFLSLAANSYTICSGSSQTFGVSGANTYTWVPAATLSNPNIANPVASPTTTTVYSVTGTNSSGCTNPTPATVTLTVNATPSAPVYSGSNPVMVCQGTTTTLSVTPTGTITSSPVWYNGSSFRAAGTNYAPPTLTVGTTVYSVEDSSVVFPNFCTSPPLTITVTVNAAPSTPVYSGSNPVMLCQGTSTTLSVTSSGGTAPVWYSGASYRSAGTNYAPPTLTVGTTVYNVIDSTLTPGGCNSSPLTITVTVNPAPIASFTVGQVCEGTASFFDASASTFASGYNWDFGGTGTATLTIPTDNYTYPTAGTYSVSLIVSNIEGCTSAAIGYAVVIPSPTVSYTLTNVSLHTYDAYPTYSSNVDSARWYWGDGTSTAGLYPSHTYSAAGTYSICVTVTDTAGCTATSCQNDAISRLSNNSPLSTMVYINVSNGQTTGIAQVTSSNELNIYPNPNNGSFVIEPQNTMYNVHCTVYDVNGKLVLSQAITGKTSIDANSLNEGVYNISLQSNEGVVNKRLVIVR